MVQDERGRKVVKQWRAQEECQGLEGLDGKGGKMSALCIKSAIKIHH